MSLQVVKSGTVSVTGGSDQVVGLGTSFAFSAVAGGLFYCGGLVVPIDTVADDTHLTLALPWPGIAASGQRYAIWRAPSDAANILDASQRLREVVTMLQAGQLLQPDATGTAAERAAYDGQPKGFVYVRTDVSPLQVAVKRTAANADWSAWSPFQGPSGPPGRDGLNGAPGVSATYDVQLSYPAQPQAGQELLRIIVPRAAQFPSNLVGSFARLAVAPSDAAAVFSLRRNDAQWATLTFDANATFGIFAGGVVNFAAGDELTIVAPTPRNPALARLSLSLAGTRL